MAVLHGLFVSVCESSNHTILWKLEQDGRAIEYLENLTKTEWKPTSPSNIEKQILMRLS